MWFSLHKKITEREQVSKGGGGGGGSVFLGNKSLLSLIRRASLTCASMSRNKQV